MPVSLPDLHNSLKSWIAGRIRIDSWTLNDPQVSSTKLEKPDGTFALYPANTAVMLPAEKITYNLASYGPICEADFPFLVKYRFPKGMEYHNVPLLLVEGVLNNLYYLAVNYFKDIHPDVITISSPDIGVDVNVRPAEGKTAEDKEWVVVAQPAYRIQFYADVANLDGLQPGGGEGPTFEFDSLAIGVYRADLADEIQDIEAHFKDDEIIITAAELEEDENPSPTP